MMDGVPADWRDTYEARGLYRVAIDVHQFLLAEYGWWFEVDDLVAAAWLGVSRYGSNSQRRRVSVAVRKEMISHAWDERRAMDIGMDPTADEDSMGEGLVEFMADERAGHEVEALECHDMLAWLRRRVPALGRTAYAVDRYYVDGWTLKQIGDSLGLTRERVRQIIQEHLDRVRRFVQGRGLTYDG